MNSGGESVTIRILEKDYQVACPRGERAALMEAARYLDERMREVRDSRKIIGGERIAVMVALNIANELLRAQSESRNQGGADNLKAGIRSLQQKVETALLNARQMEL